jgi:pSer/pThr/pTyr-binding forkhead associated (FHA) protein
MKSTGFDGRVIELNLGVNRVGRSPKNEIQIEHPTISSLHCEISLTDDGVVVHDCDSTNGTFVGGQRIGVVRLSAGQSLQLGDVELLVETTDVTQREFMKGFERRDFPSPSFF